MSAPEWMSEGSCAQTDPEAFFPETTVSRAAKAVCARCPVVIQCYQYALARPELFGIWGGSSRHERLERHRGAA